MGRGEGQVMLKGFKIKKHAIRLGWLNYFIDFHETVSILFNEKKQIGIGIVEFKKIFDFL